MIRIEIDEAEFQALPDYQRHLLLMLSRQHVAPPRETPRFNPELGRTAEQNHELWSATQNGLGGTCQPFDPRAKR